LTGAQGSGRNHKMRGECPTQFRFHESRWREAEFKNQEKGYEKKALRENSARPAF
jgi:hypothetical protein